MEWATGIIVLIIILLVFTLIMNSQTELLVPIGIISGAAIIAMSASRGHSGSNETDGACDTCGKHKDLKGGALEFEAKFLDIDDEDLRKRLKKLGAKQVHPNIKLRRVAYRMPSSAKGFIRVRDDGGHVSMTSKVWPTEGESRFPEENEVHIKEDFEVGKKFLDSFLHAKAYQETMREKWELPKKYGCAEIALDTIPGLNKYVEIECESEDAVKHAAKELGFDYADAHFGSFAKTLFEEYGIPEDYTNEEVPVLTFANVREALEAKVEKNKDKFESAVAKYSAES